MFHFLIKKKKNPKAKITYLFIRLRYLTYEGSFFQFLFEMSQLKTNF